MQPEYDRVGDSRAEQNDDLDQRQINPLQPEKQERPGEVEAELYSEDCKGLTRHLE
jgi:hypothetical protein